MDKLTVYLNEYEYSSLHWFRTLFVLTGRYISEIPEMNEIIKGIVFYSHYAMLKNENIALELLNKFLIEANLPPRNYHESLESLEIGNDIEILDDTEEEDSDNVIKNSREKEKTFNGQWVSRYVLTVDEKMGSLLDEIKLILSHHGSIRESSRSDLIRKTIHLVLDNKKRTYAFLMPSLIGSIFRLSPCASIDIFFGVGDNFAFNNKDRENLEKLKTIQREIEKSLGVLPKHKFKAVIAVRREKLHFMFGIPVKKYDQLKQKAQIEALSVNMLDAYAGLTSAAYSLLFSVDNIPSLFFDINNLKKYSIRNYLEEFKKRLVNYFENTDLRPNEKDNL